MLKLIWQELETPTGQIGPLHASYLRAAGGVWHSVAGAIACNVFGSAWGLALALPLAAIYWLVKETGDLRRGGRFTDGIEDAVMVGLGAWYGAGWWPLALCAAGLTMMASAAWRGGDGAGNEP